MLIPSPPDARLIDEAGYVSSEWRVYFDEISEYLRAKLPPDANRFFFERWLQQDGSLWLTQDGNSWLLQ